MDTCAHSLVHGDGRSSLGQEPILMNNSISDDYFSFMSSKWEGKHAIQRLPTKAPPATSLLPSDTIDFVEESQIEVTESFVSDTVIQRIFKRFSAG
jgi:hypothetical protein